MSRLILLLALGALWPAVALAGDKARDNQFGGHSDEELTALAADWDSLDRHQRRALLTEMKLRMARTGERKGLIHIRTERRYGRLIRQADGRVIRIETQVVHVRPVKPEDLEALEGRHGFGVGFEQRVARREEAHTRTPTAEVAAPAPAQGDTSLNGVLESLDPSTQAPALDRLPIYQASDPKP